MKYDVKMNIKRALSLYLATSVIATNPGTIAAATALIDTKEDTTAVVSEVVEVEEYLEETTEDTVVEESTEDATEDATKDEVVEDAAEDTTEDVVEDSTSEDKVVPQDKKDDVAKVPEVEEAGAPSTMSVDADIPVAVSAAPSGYLDWNSTTSTNIGVEGIATYTFKKAAGGVTPVPTIKMRNAAGTVFTATLNDHYRLSYSNNTTIGEATMTITGIGDYAGQTYDYKFNIGAYLTDCTVTLDGDLNKDNKGDVNVFYTYTGSAIQPSPTVTLYDVTLVEGTDYTVSYANTSSTALGSYSLTLGAVSGRTATNRSVAYAIEGYTLSDYTEIDAIADIGYITGSITPEITVKLKKAAGADAIGTELVKDKDYTVVYSNNKGVGTGTVTITGKGNYSGTLSKTFEITDNKSTNLFAGDNQLDISGLTFAVFSGTPVTTSGFKPSVKYNLDGTAPTTALTQNTWWKGFLISAADDTEAEAIAGKLSKMEMGTATAAEQADVAASLEAAGYPDATNYYTVVGISSFLGSWAIESVPVYGNLAKATVTPTTAAGGEEQLWWPWTGADVTPDYWEVKIGDYVLDPTTDFEVQYPEDISSTGVKKATITHFDASNGATEANAELTGDALFYSSVTKNYGVEVVKFDIDDVVDVEDGVFQTAELFTGDYIIPDFKITLEDHTDSGFDAGAAVYLTPDVDYTVTAVNNLVIGTATATVKGIGGYDGVSFTVDFTIEADTGTNQFGEDETSGDADGSKLTHSSFGFKIFEGTPVAASSISPSITWTYTDGKTTPLTKGTYYEGYFVKYNADETLDVDGLASELASGTALSEVTGVTGFDYEECVTGAGTPGNHVYLIIGIGTCEGSYWYDDIPVYGNLSKATVSPVTNVADPADPAEYEEQLWWDWDYDADVKPESWLVKIGDYVLTEGVDFDVDYPEDIASPGVKKATIKHADFENKTEANDKLTGDAMYYSSVTKNYGVQALTFDIDDIFGGVTDGKMNEVSLFTGEAVDPEIAIWKDYDNDYDDQDTQNPTDDPELFLTEGTDYSYTCTDNLVAGTATATIKGLGGFAGVEFTVEFDISADTNTNVFEGTTTFTAIADQPYYGDALLATSVTPKATCEYTPGKNVTLTEGTYMTPMLVNLGVGYDAATLADGGLETLLDTIFSEIAAHEADPENTAISDAVQGYIDAAGQPGLNVYIVCGAGTFEGSYAGTTFNIKAMLADATLTWYDKDPAGTYAAGEEAVAVDDYYVATTSIFPQLTLKDYVIPASQYTILPTDTSVVALNDLTASSGTKAVSTAVVDADSFTYGAGTGEVVIKGYSFEDATATVDITIESSLDYQGFTLSNAPTGFDYALGDYTHDDLVRNVDYTVSYLNTKNMALGTSATPPTVVITGIGLYEGTIEKTFDIVLNAASYITVEEVKPQEYANASAITPTPSVTVTVTDDADETQATYTETYELVEGTDFVYSYADNYLCGVDTASVTITLLGNYASIDAETINFTIAASMEDTVVSSIDAKEYTATAITLAYDDTDPDASDFTIKYNNVPLEMSAVANADVLADVTGATVHDGDFYVTYEDNTDIGTATVTFHAVDGSPFFGTTTATFDIETIALTDYEIKIADDAEVGFTGDYIKPAFTLEYKAPAASAYALTPPTATLTEGTDYTVEYFNNVKVGAGADETFANGGTGVLTPYIKVTGVGIYEGSVVYGGFDIEAGAYNLFEDGTAVGLIATKDYTGTAQTQVIPVLTVADPLTGGTKNIFVGTDFTIGGTITDVLGLPDGTDGTHADGNYTSGDGSLATDGYTGNVDPGEATMYLIGVNDYVDSYLEVNFDVIADLSKASVYFTNGKNIADSVTEHVDGKYDWTGSDVAPTFEVIYNYDADNELTLAYDANDSSASIYSITRDVTNVSAGDKTFQIAPTTNDLGKYYKGSLEGTYTIDQIDVTGATKSDADTLGDVTYAAEDIVLAFTGLSQMPSHEDLELLFGTYELTEDDYTIALKTGSDGIGTGLDEDGEEMTCVITGQGNFTGAFEFVYTIGAADPDALLETAYLDDIASQVFVGSISRPTTKVWVEIDGEYVDQSDFFDFAYSSSFASNAARCTAIGKTGTIYAGGKVETTFALIGDLSKATMSFADTDDGSIDIQLAFMSGDDVLCDIPASAYTVSGATVDTKTSTITFTVTAVNSQFYTGSTTGTTSFGLSMNTNDTLMVADAADSVGNSDGILDAAEFAAVLTAYKATYAAGTDFTDEDNLYTTYQSGVLVNSTGCAAFVYELADKIFGAGTAPETPADGVPTGEYDHYVITRDQLRVGDYYHTGTHWGIFTEVNGNSYKTAEGNVGGKVVYDRTVTVADLTGDEVVFYSRYPYAK